VNIMLRSTMTGLLSLLVIGTLQPAYARDRNIGMASFYSGTRGSHGELTAAHRSLRFGTRVRVTSVASGRSVVVRINDRGPYISGRIIDLSHPAAALLNMVSAGVTRVRLEVVENSP
jgi:rare lipoprotein A